MDKASLEHTKKVSDYIKKTIDEKGIISFAEFMDYALYAPGLGYYSVGTQKFGEHGDFVTAPEISGLFSKCLANFCIPILKEQGGSIFEFGAGTGVMAVDILLYLEQKNALPEHYYILELSADLRQRQKETIEKNAPNLVGKVVWLDRLPKEPITAIVIANEVLDAMPVSKFKIQSGEVFEYFVDYNDDKFEWVLEPADEFLEAEIKKLNILEVDGYESEINLAINPWLSVVSNMLKKGHVLLIDYGFLRHEYYHPERNMGTLKCHYRHQSSDNPLERVGVQDITAHVDFSAVGDAAEANGMKVVFYSNQAKFLIENGLLDLVKKEGAIRYAQKIKMLTSPTEMGEMFKVMVLEKAGS